MIIFSDMPVSELKLNIIDLAVVNESKWFHKGLSFGVWL